MKHSNNIIICFLSIILILVLASCKNKSIEKFSNESASIFLNNYFYEWNKGNIDKIIPMTHGSDTLTDEERTRLISSLKKGRDQLFEKNGGIRKISLRNLEVTSNPKKRISNYYVKYVNGGGMEISRYLIIENGEYKLSLYSVN